MSDAGLRIGYFDATGLAHLAADPGAAGQPAAELVTAVSIATTSELSLAEVPHRVRERFADMVDVARVAWPWLIDELTLVQLEVTDLEVPGAAGWAAGETCTSVHLAVAAKIGASDYVHRQRRGRPTGPTPPAWPSPTSVEGETGGQRGPR